MSTMFNGRPRTFVRVSMGCQFAGTRVLVDSIFQPRSAGVLARSNVRKPASVGMNPGDAGDRTLLRARTPALRARTRAEHS